MGTYTIIRHAFGSTGAPLSGLSPTFASYINAATGSSMSAPAITGIGGGAYAAVVDDNACGNIDFGLTALHRYATVEARTTFTFPAFSASTGAPLAGLTPTWQAYTDAAGASASAPTITALGSGWYKCAIKPTAKNAQIDLGSTASPRYVPLDTDETDGLTETDAPSVTNISPSVGSTVTATEAISFDVTDSGGGLRRIILHAQFAGRSVVEVVFDGTNFAPLYTASARTVISGGYSFSVTRTGGWPSAPTFLPYAIDLAGNETI